MDRRAQTAIEYLFLTGASILIVILVSMSTRNTIMPAGQDLPVKSAQIVTAEATFKITPTPIPTPTGDICVIGAPCGDSTFWNESCPEPGYHVIQKCANSCTRHCIANNVCGECTPTTSCTPICAPDVVKSCSIDPTENNEQGPFDADLRVRFYNLASSPAEDLNITTLKIFCNTTNSADPGTSVTNFQNNNDPKRARRNNCHYNPVLTDTTVNAYATAFGVSCTAPIYVRGSGNPACTMTATPPNSTGPFQSQITVNFTNLDNDVDHARMRCNATDPGIDVNLVRSGGTTYATRLCNYPAASSNTAYYANASADTAFCSVQIIDYAPAPTCILSASPTNGTGPFGSVISAVFTNLNSGFMTARIRCNSSDAGMDVPLVNAGPNRIANRTCNYPSVLATTTYSANASASTASCSAQVRDDPVVPACDINQCQLQGSGGLFYSYIVQPKYFWSPAFIHTDNTSISCYTGGPVCSSYPCRIRSSKVSQNTCILIEDHLEQSQYDWNDFIFTTNITDYGNGTQMLSVMDSNCDTAATDELFLKLSFSTKKSVRDMDTGDIRNGTRLKFKVWPDCHPPYLGNVRRFSIINDTTPLPPMNFGPVWEAIPNPAPIGRTMDRSIRPWPYVWDEDDTETLNMGIFSNSNSSVATCTYSPRFLDWMGNPIDDLGPIVSCTGANAGNTTITLQATDSAGVTTYQSFTVTVITSTGPVFNMPPSIATNVGNWTVFDLYWYASDPLYLGYLSFNVIGNTNSSNANCIISGTHRLRCDGLNAGISNVTVDTGNPDNQHANDTITVYVTP